MAGSSLDTMAPAFSTELVEDLTTLLGHFKLAQRTSHAQKSDSVSKGYECMAAESMRPLTREDLHISADSEHGDDGRGRDQAPKQSNANAHIQKLIESSSERCTWTRFNLFIPSKPLEEFNYRPRSSISCKLSRALLNRLQLYHLRPISIINGDHTNKATEGVADRMKLKPALCALLWINLINARLARRQVNMYFEV